MVSGKPQTDRIQMNWCCDVIKVVLCFLALTTLSLSAAGAAEPVSIESLLNEMVNRDSVARYPKTDFRLKQASSYDRSSKTPDDPKGWFSNFDRNTSDKHQNFVRTEENDGRKEWVVMEDDGAGVITRFWVPWQNQLKPGTDIVIRFYLDGASEPTIEGNMFELFQGKGLIPFPLAHESLRSAVSFFPIPYAKSCKVTMSDHPFFFQFTYREYKQEVDVKTFSMEDFLSAKSLIDTTCRSLLNPDEPAAGDVVKLEAVDRRRSAAVGITARWPGGGASAVAKAGQLRKRGCHSARRSENELRRKGNRLVPHWRLLWLRHRLEPVSGLVSHGRHRRHDDQPLGDAVPKQCEGIDRELGRRAGGS